MENLKSRWMGRAALLIGAVGIVAAGIAAYAPPAQACGGFFCNQSAPVNQQAEEIIFVDNGDETTTMVVRIQYQGPAEQFAWLLPVTGVPDVEVSANMALDRLRGFTDPQYNLEVELEGECMEEIFFDDLAADSMAPPPVATTAGEADSGVMILDEGSVGPFDFVTISVDESKPDAADVAVEWLTENGYDVTSVGADVLRPYLEDGLNLIAFRLTKGNEVGAIRPVMLTYPGDKPSIPIRPTAVAAQPDMGIRVWTMSASQAIPKNYKALVVNEALINWFNYRQNYDEVITAAADEAGGQGFVTELAGSSDVLDAVIFSSFDQQEWMSYQLGSYASGFQAMQEARWRYSGWDGWVDVVCDNLNLPEGQTCQEWGATPNPNPSAVAVSANEFIEQLFERVIKPVIDTQQLVLSRPYMTRLYSTMSAEEMTLDPLFDWNGDLADVSNIHTAKQFIECSPELLPWEAPYRIELPQGGVIRGEGSQVWPIGIDDLPANLAVVQLTTQGAGEIVEDNREAILQALFEQSGEMASGDAIEDLPDTGVPIGGMIPGDPTSGGDTGTGMGPTGDGDGVGTDPTITGMDPDDGGDGGGDGGGLCAVGEVGAEESGRTLAGLLLFAVGLVVGRRRRR